MRRWLAMALTALLGCGSRSVGFLEGEPVGGSDGGSGGQGAGATGGTGGTSAATAFGAVSVAHLLEDGPYGQEGLSLAGAFYGQDYDPEAIGWGYVDTLVTPDGVACDLYYTSAMGGGGGPPEPPPQLDAGKLTAGAGSDPDGRLEILFDGDQYSVDWRSPASSEKPWPDWGSPPDAVALSFGGAGSSHAGPFTVDLILPAMPTLVSPPPSDQPFPPLNDGNFLIRWQPTAADELLVVLQFNLDWDDSAFHCRPAAGTTELLIPAAWIVEWTWGSGAVQVFARNGTWLTATNAEVRLRAQRLAQRYVLFDVLWP